ncbi:unnamed protein product [Moneuplotes crassus]|uniref:Uncharacterized protein n=1 Tax=Euplotes crassus TaxID=5936 RepID=A0AAD1XRA0_EUPCR|nr:unnamed protein product [Moneuplotes crassus]
MKEQNLFSTKLYPVKKVIRRAKLFVKQKSSNMYMTLKVKDQSRDKQNLLRVALPTNVMAIMNLNLSTTKNRKEARESLDHMIGAKLIRLGIHFKREEISGSHFHNQLGNALRLFQKNARTHMAESVPLNVNLSWLILSESQMFRILSHSDMLNSLKFSKCVLPVLYKEHKFEKRCMLSSLDILKIRNREYDEEGFRERLLGSILGFITRTPLRLSIKKMTIDLGLDCEELKEIRAEHGLEEIRFEYNDAYGEVPKDGNT